MTRALIFEGRCWTFGDNVPTDSIIPTHALLQSGDDIRKHVLAGLNPEFPERVQPGDVLCAGRNFGCSSGRAMAPKALWSTGVSVVVAESFSRTFYRNGYEVGLPILELPGITQLAREGDRLRVDVRRGLVENLTTGRSLDGDPPPSLLLRMLEAGGLIPLVRSGEWTERALTE